MTLMVNILKFCLLNSVVNSSVQFDLELKSNRTDRLRPLSRTDGIVNISSIDFPSVSSTYPSIPLISLVWPHQFDKSSQTELNCDLKIFKSNWVNPISSVQSSSVRLVLNNTNYVFFIFILFKNKSLQKINSFSHEFCLILLVCLCVLESTSHQFKY